MSERQPGARAQAHRDVPADLLESLIGGKPILRISDDSGLGLGGEASYPVVLASRVLQNLEDHRGAIRQWFALVAESGWLIVTVPHAFLSDRTLSFSARRRPEQKRLYTPASLMEEVEEALAPNTYRVRRLIDHDEGYDYHMEAGQEPVGGSDIVLMLQRVDAPAWPLAQPVGAILPPPDPVFEPLRTRGEVAALAPHRRILVLKLDHLGDFIMGLPGLEKLRVAFPDAHITLVVGSWNVALAEDAAIADRLLAFDVFPRNSSEQPVDVPGKTALFQALVTEDYDIAIDLRTDGDTRFLLQSVRAGLRAGMGTRTRFPYLDIFLPIDGTRDEPEQARRDVLDHHGFASKPEMIRTPYRIACRGDDIPRDNALIWGPYLALRAGRYVFEPFLEMEQGQGAVLLDIGVNAQRVCGAVVPSDEPLRLPFTVSEDGQQFEFRIWAMQDAQIPNFSFYGGRLIRQGGGSVLHQSEYLLLLIELIRLRVAESGLLCGAERL